MNPEIVAVGTALAEVRGHLRVASELYPRGDIDGAEAHAGHPAAELLDSIRAELEEFGGDATGLESSLEALTTAIHDQEPDPDVQALIETAMTETRTAETSVAGEAADDPAYIGSVIAQVVSTAGLEYGEAVVDGQLELLIEFQDAYGFVTEGRELYSTIVDDVPEAEAAEIEEGFETLQATLAGPRPAGSLADPDAIAAAAGGIGSELTEAVGALAVTISDPATVVARINELLDEILEEVEAGDSDAAAELAAEAYLENYEVIEGGVIEAAPDVNEELEPLLGAELRRQISEGASADEILASVDRARELLDDALAALEAAEH